MSHTEWRLESGVYRLTLAGHGALSPIDIRADLNEAIKLIRRLYHNGKRVWRGAAPEHVMIFFSRDIEEKMRVAIKRHPIFFLERGDETLGHDWYLSFRESAGAERAVIRVDN